jgi:hypothetical protein
MNWKVYYRSKGKTHQINIIGFNIADTVKAAKDLGVEEAQILAIILIDE